MLNRLLQRRYRHLLLAMLLLAAICLARRPPECNR